MQARAKRVRKQTKNDQQLEHQKAGLTKQQYWTNHVKNEEDVVKFYSLYNPEYPDILARALARKFTEVLCKHNSGQELTSEEKELLAPYSGPSRERVWDPMEDIQAEMMKAKIALAEKNMSELLNQ